MKKKFKRCVSIMLFIVLFMICGEFWKYILIDDTNSYTRIMMHQMYEADENIDIIFVGSSHVYRSLIPSVTDDEFGCYTFNVGSSSQQMDGSLALIKEVAIHNDLKHVYLELYYGVANGMDYSDRTALTSTYILSDYMRPSIRKLSYLLRASSKKYWVNSFIRERRNWTVFFDADYVKNLVIRKGTYEYKNYILPVEEGQTEYYVDRGFVAADDIVPEGTYWNEAAINSISVDSLKGSDWEESLLAAIDYCKKNDIEITLFVTPEPEWTILGVENYQDYHNYIQEIADTKEVEFYDFNLCSNEYLDANDRMLFKDTDHLNTFGAEKFSHIFGEIFTGKIDKETIFYNSITDKMEDEEPMVYGLAGPKDDPENGIRKCKVISNRVIDLEYRIIATTAEGKQYYIQDFEKTREFTLPIGEKGIITVVWRNVSSPEEVNTFEVGY